MIIIEISIPFSRKKLQLSKIRANPSNLRHQRSNTLASAHYQINSNCPHLHSITSPSQKPKANSQKPCP
jgi:hypothetical protein